MLSTEAIFCRRDADSWTISYAGEELLLRDAKGMRYLCQLLARPGESLAAVELAASTESGAERARSAVTKRIRDAIGKIAARHAGLGYHLRKAVRTGAYCIYEPDPGHPTRWRTSIDPSG